MSDPSAAFAAVESRPSRWPLWLGLVCLAVAAAPQILEGLSAWRTDDVLRKTVGDFFEEVALGRKDAALAYLSDEYRSAIQPGGFPADDQPWQPSDEFSSRILSVRQSSTTAEVQIALAKSGFSLKPTVHLRRLPDHSWRITRIEGVDVDPHWTRWKARELQEAEESLAEELAEKLIGSPPE